MNASARPTPPRWLGRRNLVELGRFRVPAYTAMLYLGCVAGIFVGTAVAGAQGLPEQRFALAAVVLLVPALAGARLWFVAQHLERFRGDPRRIWRRSEGGSALYGGFALSVVASVPVLRLADLPFWGFWDAGGVSLLVGLVLTRAGCLMHGCCAGKPTSGPFGVRLPNSRGEWRRRFPTQLAEAAWAALVVIVALAAWPSMPSEGALFGLVVSGYAAGRIALEPTREVWQAERSARANVAFSGALLLGAGGLLASGWLA